MQRLLILPLLLLAAACDDGIGPDEEVPNSTRYDAVTRAFDSALVASGIQGATFVVAQGDSVIYLRTGGTLGGDVIIQASTASQWVAGATIMSLVDAGLLRLTDSIGQWIPNAPADKRGITLRQLVSHTSGLAATDSPCLANRSTSLASCAAEILAAPLASTPGSAFSISQNGWQVAGHLAELASGGSWSGLVQARVTSRLALALTAYPGGGNPRVASGLNTTTLELATILANQLFEGRGDDGRVLSAATTLLLERDQTGGRAVAFPGVLGSAVGHGVGVYVETAAATGAGVVLSAPSANGIYPWIDRGRGIVAVFATQSSLQQAGPMAAMLRREFQRVYDTPVTD